MCIRDSLDAIPSLANSLANIIKSLYGRNKKALVLDLDNTLWGGVVGDDGVDGIAVGPEEMCIRDSVQCDPPAGRPARGDCRLA